MAINCFLKYAACGNKYFQLNMCIHSNLIKIVLNRRLYFAILYFRSRKVRQRYIFNDRKGSFCVSQSTLGYSYTYLTRCEYMRERERERERERGREFRVRELSVFVLHRLGHTAMVYHKIISNLTGYLPPPPSPHT